jgi:hypothetical protein
MFNPYYSYLNESEVMMAKTSKKPKPVYEIRLGRIKAAIWANETDNGTRHNVTLSRLYKVEGEDWQDSTSFGRDDLPLVAKVADMAHTWIFQKTQEQNGSARESGDGTHPQEQEKRF